MDNKKTLIRQKKLQRKSKIKIGEMSFREISPTKEMAAYSTTEMIRILSECLIDGDKEAFQEILEGYIRSKNISKISKKFKLSRSLIYEAIDTRRNPSLETICKIMKAFKADHTLVKV